MWCSNNRSTRRNDRESGGMFSESACKGGNWTGLNLVAMILGFVFLWPLGLFMVFWICSGRSVQQIPAAASELWARTFGNSTVKRGEHSDNVVFNDYQQTQYDRISEIKEEIKSRAQRFRDFKSDVQRRADEEEFNRFMNDAPTKGDVAS